MSDTQKHQVKAAKRRGAWRLLIVGVALSGVIAYSSCGDSTEFNLFKPLAESSALKNNHRAKIEEARVRMDKRDYEGALDLLQPMINDSDEDSNETRLLYASATLGAAELDVWSLISKILGEEAGPGQASGGGLNEILNQFSDSLLGEGSARTQKIEALAAALEILRATPGPVDKDIKNSSCLFAGILAVPTVTDAQAGAARTLAALREIEAAAQDGGATCPNISELDAGIAQTSLVADRFNLILEAAKDCSFLDLDETEALMNQVQQSLSKLMANADRGCSAPNCPASAPDCEDLFPVCVREVIDESSGTSQASDRQISACEIVLNCTVGSACF